MTFLVVERRALRICLVWPSKGLPSPVRSSRIRSRSEVVAALRSTLSAPLLAVAMSAA
jgi:hypothetical protein